LVSQKNSIRIAYLNDGKAYNFKPKWIHFLFMDRMDSRSGSNEYNKHYYMINISPP